MSIERVTEPDHLHVERYEWAGRFTLDSDVVLDAACGTGYGKQYLHGTYIGADKHPGHLEVDLETWTPDFDYDVFVGLETLEHLPDYSTYVETAKRARREIIISTPIVPTKHVNEFHVHDFTKEQVVDIFAPWVLLEYRGQEDIYGLFRFGKEEQILGPSAR